MVFPVPRAIAWVAALGTCVLVLVHSLELTRWAYADWTAASAEFRQSLTLAGCWIAGSAAWCSSTFSSTQSLICPITGPRRGRRLVVRQLLVLVSWCLLGYILGLLPMLMWVQREATWGGPDALVIGGAVCLLVGFVCLGYLCGAIAPRLLAIPLAASAAFAVLAFSGYNGRPSAPIYPFDVVAGTTEVEPIALFRLLFFAASACLLGAAAAWWFQERRQQLSFTPVAGVGIAVAAVMLVGAAGDRGTPSIIARDVDAVPSCADVGPTTVCLHPARRVMLTPIADAVARMGEVIPLSGVVSEVNDAAIWREPSPGVVNLQLQYNSAQWLQIAVIDVAYQVSGADVCRSQSEPVDVGGTAPQPVVVSEAIAMWLSGLAGGPLTSPYGADPRSVAVAKRLSDASVVEVTAAIRRILPDVQACRARLRDLPA